MPYDPKRLERIRAKLALLTLAAAGTSCRSTPTGADLAPPDAGAPALVLFPEVLPIIVAVLPPRPNSPAPNGSAGLPSPDAGARALAAAGDGGGRSQRPAPIPRPTPIITPIPPAPRIILAIDPPKL